MLVTKGKTMRAWFVLTTGFAFVKSSWRPNNIKRRIVPRAWNLLEWYQRFRLLRLKHWWMFILEAAGNHDDGKAMQTLLSWLFYLSHSNGKFSTRSFCAMLQKHLSKVVLSLQAVNSSSKSNSKRPSNFWSFFNYSSIWNEFREFLFPWHPRSIFWNVEIN